MAIVKMSWPITCETCWHSRPFANATTHLVMTQTDWNDTVECQLTPESARRRVWRWGSCRFAKSRESEPTEKTSEPSSTFDIKNPAEACWEELGE